MREGAAGLVRHEMAHAMEFDVLTRRAGIKFFEANVTREQVNGLFARQFEVSSEVLIEAFKRLGIGSAETADVEKWFDKSRADVRQHISIYGAKNSREALAEALACEDKNNKTCNTVKEVWNELLKKEGLL